MMTDKEKVLKISTCGSVDDGKSTLIGRLLYDTHSLKKDKLEAIERASRQRGYDYLDFSLATDGLVAEREQGITIDVAHIYFSTPNRSFIIADTPGHIEYTRNMVTGTSTSQLAIILVDARNGVVTQTRRHFFINNLLRTKNILVAINKMDLVDYDQDRFLEIISDFKKLTEASTYKEQKISYIPISALYGDNIVNHSDNIHWYHGKTLLDYLEALPVDKGSEAEKTRFQVQTVIRPKTARFHDYRGYAGKLNSGKLSVGDEVTVLPSGTQSKVKTISFFDQQYQSASKGSSISITLEDNIDISRGDLLVKTDELPSESKLLTAKICWMDPKPLRPNSIFLLQHGVKRVKSKVKSVAYKIDIETEENVETDQLKVNDLGLVEIQLAQPLHFDDYNENKATGAFILIDAQTNNTAGVGFIGN